MISYKRDVLERQSLSEVKMGRGSPICERVRKKIVEYFKNNVPQRQIAKALQISSSTVHNIIKRFRETGEISVRKGQDWRPLLDACGLRALRQHCITHQHDKMLHHEEMLHHGKHTPIPTILRPVAGIKFEMSSFCA